MKHRSHCPAVGHEDRDIESALCTCSQQKKSLITFDLDSTLCDTGHRHHMIDRVNGTDWKAYSLACVDDAPVAGLVLVARLLASLPNVAVHGLSARNGVAALQTAAWMRKHGVPLKEIHLDPGESVDYTADYTHAMYKYERLRQVEEQTGLKCILHFDDYAEVAAEFAKHDIPVVCVRTPQEIAELAERKAAGLH